MKRKVTTVLFVFAALVLFTGCFYSKTDEDINHYLNSGTYMDAQAAEIMPALESLPEYNKAYYKFYIHNDYTCSMLLVVNYERATYEREREKLDDIYSFLDHAVKYEFKGEVSEDDFLIPENEFSIGNYYFRVIENKGNIHAYYPHSFGMISTSDEKSSIAYLYFYDQSLDVISDSRFPKSMAEFVEENFLYDWYK